MARQQRFRRLVSGAGSRQRGHRVAGLVVLAAAAAAASGQPAGAAADGPPQQSPQPPARVLSAHGIDPWPENCPDDDGGHAEHDSDDTADDAASGGTAAGAGDHGRTPPAEDPARCLPPPTDEPVAVSAVLVTFADGASSDGASAAAASYPGTLVNETGLVRLYTTADQWEVWICDVPNRNVAYTLDDVLDYLNGPVSDYFAWLSDDQYDVSFVPGGILRSAHSWDPGNVHTFQHTDCGGDTTGCANNRPCKHYTARSGLPEITVWDDVASNGIYVGFNHSQFTAPVGGITGLFTYVRCRVAAGCATDFPENQRTIYGDGALFSADTRFGRPLLETSVHELGHAIEWPHSYWRTGFGEYHNRVDVMSGGPWRVATPAINRLAAGWIDDGDVATHLSTTGAANYTLSSPGAGGLQAVTLPGDNATEYYVFGARSLQTNDWLYVPNGQWSNSPTVLAEGVEGYYIDQTCETKDSTTGACVGGASFGLRRRTEPVYPASGSNAYTGHMLGVGEWVRANDLRVDVVDRKGLDWTIWVGSRHGPDRPRNVRVTRDSGTQLTVGWAPAASGASSSSFDVEYRSGSNAWASPTSGSGTCANSLSSVARSCTITGLTAGTAYDVRVRGVGGAPHYGDGSWTPVGSAVRNPEVTAGAAGLVVRWDPPADGAGFSAVRHLVQVRSGANSFAAPSAGTCSGTVAASATRCTITGLTNGAAYTVRIAAVDSSGSGVWSRNLSATPTASLPAAAAKPAVAGSAATLTVSWPAAGTDVTGHAVSYRTGSGAFAAPSGGTCSGTIAASATSCTITGLSNGTGYEVRRRLVTSAGSGPWSPPASGMARAQPAAPAGVTVTAAHQALEVAWDAPSSADAPASASARVEYGVGASPAAWTLGCAIADIAVRTCRIASLANSTAYSVRVRFSNGTDSAWTTATGTPATTAPLQLARPKIAVNAHDSLRVTWTAPSTAAQTGGSAVTGYRLEHRVWTTSAAAPWTSHTVAGPAASVVIGGLDTYQRYQVRVRAVNTVGSGPWSAPATGYIAPVTAATAPTAVTAVVRGSSLDITWTPPAADKVLFYELRLESRADSSSTWADQAYIGDCAALRADAAACSVTKYSAGQNLDSTKQHRVSLRSANHRGDSAWSAAVQATTAAGGATPSFGTSTIADQSWVTGTAVTALHLPPASGGTGALAYTLSPALPAGLSFSAATRQITGTPTAATTGAATYTYTVTDSATPTANTASLAFTVTVSADSAPVLAAVADLSAPTRRPIKTIQLPAPNTGTGNGTAVYSLEGTLPAGLTFDAATRSIGGTPTLASPAATLPKTFDLAWTARDADGDSYTEMFSITVREPPPQTVSYPSRLIDQYDRVRLYTQPHPDHTFTTDVWEVWICDVPNGSLSLTPAGVAALFNTHLSPHYRWLSGGKYRVRFVAGGTHTASGNWAPASAGAMEHPGCGGTPTPGTKFADRLGIPQLVKSDDVSSKGMIVVYDHDVPTLADGQLLYDRCDPRTRLNTCPTSFPANARRIHLDGGVAKTDSNGNPTARLRIAAHEIGQAIEFPHSFSANSADRHDNLTDLLSGGAFPMGTAAVNRFAAGWIAPADAAVHQSGTGSASYVLAPLGSTGTQMLTLPGRDAHEYYALGVREVSAADALPAGKEGVEAYRVDHKASRVHSEMSCWAATGDAKECYGHKRRHEPLARAGSADTSYGHLYGVGHSRTVGELRFEVTDRSGSAYVVWVGDKDAPRAPTALLAARTGATQMTVSWTAPSSGDALTGYEVQFRAGAAAFAKPAAGTCAATLGASATSCTITGLADGTAYDVRVAAASSSGSGPWSGSARAPTAWPPSAPGAPALSSAGRTSLSVSWSAPASNGAAISGYTVQYRRTGADAWSTHPDTTPTLARTITGLTTYAKHQVRVRATNSSGDGGWSAAAEQQPLAVSKPAKPAAPTVSQTLIRRPGSTSLGSLTIAWTAPAASDVLGYSVALQSRADASAQWATQAFIGDCASLDAGDTSCTVTDYSATHKLDPKKLHRATVAATNHLGAGPVSDASASSTGFAVPPAPSASGIAHLSGTQTRFTAAVTLPHGTQMRAWELRSRRVPGVGPPGPWTGWIRQVDGEGSPRTGNPQSLRVTQLANEQRHDIEVRAASDIGAGAVHRFRVRAGWPRKPGSVTAAAGAQQVTLSASIGDTGSNSQVTAWQYKQWIGNDEPSGPWIAVGSSASPTLAHAVTGLSDGQTYRFRVRAVSGDIAGVPSDPPLAAAPAAPATSATPSLGDSAPGGGGSGSSGGGGATPLRLSDSTRYGTAKAVADQFVELLETVNPASSGRVDVSTVIVASGRAFPDALTASALARVLAAPVLLTDPNRLDSAVTAFVNKHRISKVVIVGGRAAVSAEVETAMRALSEVREVVRYFGPDRYSTAARVASEVGAPGLLCRSTKRTVILTTGRNYPDALVAGPLAYRGAHPILLTERDRLPAPIAEYLSAGTAQHAVVIGGRSAVGDAVVDAVEALGLSTQRISGSDRADTSAKVARFLTGRAGTGSCFRTDSVGLATGWAFPDALAAAPLLGQYGAPLLLTSPRGVPQPLLDYAASGRLRRDFDLPPVVTIGGASAVPPRHPTQLLASLPRG